MPTSPPATPAPVSAGANRHSRPVSSTSHIELHRPRHPALGRFGAGRQFSSRAQGAYQQS